MTPDERDAAILSLERVVKHHARSFWIATDNTEFTDLCGAGWLGAIRAVDSWDGHSSALSTWGTRLVKYAIQDYLRQQDTISKWFRGKGDPSPIFVEIDDWVTKSVGREDTHVREIVHKVDLEMILAAMNPTEARMLRSFYIDNVKLQDMASAEGVTPGRLSQRMKEALVSARVASCRVLPYRFGGIESDAEATRVG